MFVNFRVSETCRRRVRDGQKLRHLDADGEDQVLLRAVVVSEGRDHLPHPYCAAPDRMLAKRHRTGAPVPIGNRAISADLEPIDARDLTSAYPLTWITASLTQAPHSRYFSLMILRVTFNNARYARYTLAFREAIDLGQEAQDHRRDEDGFGIETVDFRFSPADGGAIGAGRARGSRSAENGGGVGREKEAAEKFSELAEERA